MNQDIVDNSSLSLKQRIDLIKECLLRSDIELKDVSEGENGFFKFDIICENESFSLHILPKNVVNSGWSEKPYIKRIQVMSFLGKEIPLNTRENSSMFLGIAFVNNEPVISVWNPFSYVFHKTNRSCYVEVESLVLGSHEGFIKTIDSKQIVLVCDKYHFGDLIKFYHEDNR